jgi:hypothetical protein
MQPALILPLQAPGSAEALTCLLQLQMKLGGSWDTAWECQVLFSDDARAAEALQVGEGGAGAWVGARQAWQGSRAGRGREGSVGEGWEGGVQARGGVWRQGGSKREGQSGCAGCAAATLPG